MLGSSDGSTGEVVIVGVVLGADPSRCTYTLIGSPSGRIGAAVPDGGGIIPMIRPAAIWRVHPPALLSPPWRAQAEGWIGSVITGPIPKSGVSPVWSLINTVVQSAAVPVVPSVVFWAMSQPALPRLSSICHEFV